ncbi:YchJ family protein [Pollutimonas bauzanensis]|nr:YchJ family metal-binding protein [Pollutimonas bauzanensis]
MKKARNASACPCGGMVQGASYAACCQPYIEGRERAPTAEHLMRSRYTAYTLGDAAYVLSTWHASTRPPELALDAAGAPHAMRWLELAVHSHTQLTETQAQVMFTARYREGGRARRLKEHSRFVLENGQWFYVDGDVDFDASSR